ncbi:uncharacterized protein ACMZJ9_001286 [Mantella aurantiaca]
MLSWSSLVSWFGFYAKPEKCYFEKSLIQFLGLVIATKGIKINPKKISTILEWPAAADKKGVQRFVSFANLYRRFIRDFSTIISPITQLNKVLQHFLWNPEAQAAFDQMKVFVTSAPIVNHPDPSLEVYILQGRIPLHPGG